MDGILLAKFAGQLDTSLAQYYRGTYNPSTLTYAFQFHDANSDNAFFICDNTHWLLCYCTPTHFYFIDTLNRNLSAYSNELNNFIETLRGSLEIERLPYRIQQEKSRACSVYCLFFAVCFSNKLTIGQSFSRFHISRDLSNNEKILKSWFTRRYRYINSDSFHSAIDALNFDK